jgi:hypothetical protein
MTDEQKDKLTELIKDNQFDIFETIQFIQKNVYSYDGNFSLNYNSKRKLWLLKGRFITVITKGFKEFTDDKLIYGNNLTLLKIKFLKQLEKYLIIEEVIK